MSNSKRKSEYNVDLNKIVAFCKKNVKYISAGILTIALIIVLAMTVGDSKSGGNSDSQENVASKEGGEEGKQRQQDTEEGEEAGTEGKDSEYTVDLPEVKELVSTYYNSYAAGDLEKLESITESLSDMEKSYIKMMNNYVENYDNVTCYTKEGQEEGSYLASATYSMKFHDVEGGLPGMDFFYIKANDKGKLYIDSLYCPFNRRVKEQETDAEIEKLIEDFGAAEDVSKIHQTCQSEYDQIIESNQDLNKMANTMMEAIQEWKTSYDPEAEKAEAEKKAEQEKKKAEKKKKKEEKKKKKEEEKKKKEEERKKEEEQKQQEAAENEPVPEEMPTEQENNSEGNTNSSGLNYVPEGTVLTANDGYNVRVSMSESAELIGTTGIGDSITVILSYAEGWTKVEWNGQTGYIRTDLLLNN